MAAALAYLEALIAANPEALGLLHDEIVVRFWAEDFEGVVRRSAGLNPGKVPDYVAAAMARSARNLGDLELASQWYREALATHPTSQDLYLGLAMTRSEAGSHREARDLLNALPANVQQSVSGCGWPQAICTARIEPTYRPSTTTTRSWQQMLTTSKPCRAKSPRCRACCLPEQALAIAYAHPDIVSDDELQRLEADALAINLRHALWAPDKRYPFPDVRQALSRIEDPSAPGGPAE